LSQAASQSGALSGARNSDGARTARTSRTHILDFQECISAIEKCSKPVIAVLHGISYGLAIDMSVSADIRIAASNTRFSVKEVDIGIAADIGTLTRLPKVVGNFSWVKEVALSAREFGAEEALRVGYVSRVVQGGRQEGYEAGLELAKLIASKSPVAVWGTKELLNYSRDSTVEEGLRYTAIWNAAMLQTEDTKAALLSGLKKTKPTFSKL
jgi:delta(3,5)-delta(2,4)-dienoyl-CoA isomerase